MPTLTFKRNLLDGSLYGLVMGSILVIINWAYSRWLPERYSTYQIALFILVILIVVIASCMTGAVWQSGTDAFIRGSATILTGLSFFIGCTAAFIYW